MAFDWTLIKTDSPVGEGDRQYWGYNLTGGAGMVLNVRLRMTVPGGYTGTTPIKGMEKEVYLPGDNTATFNPGWDLLKNEDLGNELRRYEYGYSTPGGNVLLRQTTEAKMYVSGVFRTFLVDENYTVIEGATISGGEIVGNEVRPIKHYLSLTPPTGYGTSFEALYQFDGSVDRLNDRSGNGHTLTVAGGTYLECIRNGLVNWFARGDTFLSSAVDAGLQTTGALTVEVVHVYHQVSSAEDVLVAIRGLTNAQADNSLFQISAAAATGQLVLFTEHGAGLNDGIYLLAGTSVGLMQYTAVTRASNGVDYTLYQDGKAVDAQTMGNAPDGGTNANLWIGGVSSSSYFGTISSVRYSKGKMTAAQIAEVNARLRA